MNNSDNADVNIKVNGNSNRDRGGDNENYRRSIGEKSMLDGSSAYGGRNSAVSIDARSEGVYRDRDRDENKNDKNNNGNVNVNVNINMNDMVDFASEETKKEENDDFKEELLQEKETGGGHGSIDMGMMGTIVKNQKEIKKANFKHELVNVEMGLRSIEDNVIDQISADKETKGGYDDF